MEGSAIAGQAPPTW